MSRHGGKLLVDQLVVHGADTVFSVPGESFLALLDGLYDSPIRLITCRHEAGAANMADAYGKLTGRPGIAVVTRGPGATHASVGVHTAFQDSTPLILLVGQVASTRRSARPFRRSTSGGCSGRWRSGSRRSTARTASRSTSRERSRPPAPGRPGPVVLALPEDMLASDTEWRTHSRSTSCSLIRARSRSRVMRALLAHAERPFVLVGGAAGRRGRRGDADFLEANALPAGAAFRRQDAIDNDSPSYVGDVGIGINPKLAARVREADLLLVVGPRLGEMTTSGYTLIGEPLVHVHPGAEELGRVYRPALPSSPEWSISPTPFATSASSQAGASGRAAARADYEAWQRHDPMPGRSTSATASRTCASACPTRSSRTAPATSRRGSTASGAGTRTRRSSRRRAGRWATAFLLRSLRSWSAGADRVCFAGDGDFLMSGQELATAAQYELPIIVLVVNNGMYGTIRMHQERHYPGRVVGTDLVNPDFAAYARAFGAYGATVTETAQFADALETHSEPVRRR